MPFLDCLVKGNSNESPNITIYLKPTYINRYIDFNSEQPFNAKISLAPNLFRRGTKIITSEENKLTVKDDIISISRLSNFPKNIIENILRQNCPSINNNVTERYWIGTVIFIYSQCKTE